MTEFTVKTELRHHLSPRVTTDMHRIVYRDYHRLLSRVFPYGIFYTHQGDDVVVWAVIDLRKDPAWIRDRLGQ